MVSSMSKIQMRVVPIHQLQILWVVVVTRYHHIGLSDGNVNSLEYATGGYVEPSIAGTYVIPSYAGLFSGHPNFYLPGSVVGGSDAMSAISSIE